MKLRITKGQKTRRKKLFILRIITIAVVLLGLGFSAANLHKFSKGFFAYKIYADSKDNEDTTTEALNNTNTADNDTIRADSDTVNSDSEKLNSETSLTDNLNSDKASDLYPVRPSTGEEIGELYIPKLDATLPIYEGTDEEELDKGVGHFAESVLPGEDDNTVLSGHRDTVFRKLGKVGEGDSLIVRTSAGEFKYKVKKVRIVDKNDRTVIVPKPTATLTVSTCYPFEYIGSAPKRYILVAYLASKKLKE